MLNYIVISLLVFVSIAAAVTDLKWRRVPNWLTLPAILAGLGLHLAAGGAKGLLSSVIMIAVCGGIYFALYWLGGMGAGDVKLMAAVAALASWPTAIYALVYAAVAGGLIAVAVLLFRGRLAATLRGMLKARTYREAKAAADAEDEPATQEDEAATKYVYVPYAPAIAVGTILALIYQP